MGLITGELAECIGLWLAEGDNKTKKEITFTNNCMPLLDLFYQNIKSHFQIPDGKIRMYVYSSDGKGIKLPYQEVVIKNYVHGRARKPFIIFRVMSVDLIKKWKKLVKESLNNKKLYPSILRGFFAGEGNIKEGMHNSRVLRISQGIRKEYIDDLLNELEISSRFKTKNRNYVISGKDNWDIFAKFKLADLHPNKKERFWRVYNSYKQEHYKRGYLKKEILISLKDPLTTKDLSIKYQRSFARIQDLLIDLKKELEIFNFRIGSKDYWINDPNVLIISKLKKRYLLLLEKPKQTFEISKKFKVCWKNSYKRLKELEKLDLVKINEDKKWMKKQTNKQIIII